MRTSTARAIATCLTAAALFGCDAVKTLNTKAATSEALVNSGALAAAGPAAAYAPYAVLMLPGTGALASFAHPLAPGLNVDLTGVDASTYEGAIGVQVIYTHAGSSTTYTGVVGWQGLNTSAKTVDELVTAGGLTATTTPMANGAAATLDGTTGYGVYWIRNPEATYTTVGAGSSGTFTLTSSTFNGAATDCAAIANVTSCSYSTGTMAGSFSFTANKSSGTGAATYAQTNVSFSGLPSVKVTITN